MFRVYSRILLGKYISRPDPFAVTKRIPPLARTKANPVTIIPLDRMSNLPNRELSIFIRDSASIESLRAIGLPGLLDLLTARSPFLTARELYRITVGLSRLDVIHNTGLLPLLSRCILDERKNSFLAHEIAHICVELAACTRRLDETKNRDTLLPLLSGLADEFGRKIEAASPSDLSHITSALVDVGISDPDLFASISQYATIQMGMFTGPELADLLLGFAVSGLKSDRLIRAAAPQLITRMPLLIDVQLLQLGFTACRFIDQIGDSFIDRYVAVLEDPKRSFSDVPRDVWIDFASSVERLGIEQRLPRTAAIMRRTVGDTGLV